MTALPERRIALSEGRIRLNFEHMRATQPGRFEDWQRRHEDLEARDRTYHLPRARELYARVAINTDQRAALHVTRKVLEALTDHSFMGSNGLVAEWVSVLDAAQASMYDEIRETPETPGEQSLKDCLKLMRERSYDISEGVRFIRTPLAVAALERKYYVDDLQRYATKTRYGF
jgi:hypothetical protein